VSDVEGITLATFGDTGYLIVSAQYVAKPNQSYFVVYDRLTNAYLGAFRVGGGTFTDGCERTDGVTAYAGSLAPTFPNGLFVCQDNFNSAPGVGNQDFKLVDLAKVLGAIGA
jgi:3-phytase